MWLVFDTDLPYTTDGATQFRKAFLREGGSCESYPNGARDWVFNQCEDSPFFLVVPAWNIPRLIVITFWMMVNAVRNRFE